jgi:hypothetical protein
MEFILTSNEEGKNRFLNMNLVNEILVFAIKRVCQMTKAETTFFPHTPAPRPYHTDPQLNHPIRPVPAFPPTDLHALIYKGFLSFFSFLKRTHFPICT